MALGGGTWVSQNKILPGSYINVISAATNSVTLGERGYVGVALPLSWNLNRKVITITKREFLNNSQAILGFDSTHPELLPFREMFKFAHTVYVYNLMSSGTAASNAYATAKYTGEVGNKIGTLIEANPDVPNSFTVSTKFDGKLVDSQKVMSSDELKDNDYVEWETFELATTEATTLMTGGEDGAPAVSHQDALLALSEYRMNSLCCSSKEDEVIDLYVAHTKNRRDEVGDKFQVVVCNSKLPITYNHEGVVVVGNPTTRSLTDNSLVYWVAGAIAGCPVNKSLTNTTYNGELIPMTYDDPYALETAIQQGMFFFHKVGDKINVLEDINSYIDNTEDKSSDFKYNQTIRVVDQIAIDIANLFNNRYLGKVPNDKAGRLSFWNDVVTHHRELEKLRAIEDFKAENVVVEAGDTKRSIVVQDLVTPVNAMSQLYMTVVVQ